MKKVIKVGFPIVCIAVIGGTFYMLNKLDKKVEGSLKSQYSNSVNETNIVNNESTITENEIEENVTYTVPVEQESDEEDENITENETNTIENEIDN